NGGAVEKLVIGLVADPLAEGTEIGIGSRLKCVIGIRHLCGRLCEVSLEGRVGALHTGGEAHLLPRGRRLRTRGLREQHHSRHDTNGSFHDTSPFNNNRIEMNDCPELFYVRQTRITSRICASYQTRRSAVSGATSNLPATGLEIISIE